jgi:thiol:disulfide interchange protein
MKKLILNILCLLLVNIVALAQSGKRIQFTSCFKDTKPGEGVLTITGKIENHFHVFAFDPGGDGSQIPTELKFTKSNDFEYVGKPTEVGKLIKHEVKELEIVLNYYEKEIKYEQKVKYKKKTKGTASVYLQMCNETMCERPDDIAINFDLNNNCDGFANIKAADTVKPNVAKADTNKKNTIANADTPLNNNAITTLTTGTDTNGGAKTYGIYGIPVSDCGKTQEKALSPWLAFLYGLLGGFAALFFPCTLPMIPMTISFFLKGDADKKKGVRRGITYGFFIFLVYFLLSLPFLFFNIGGDALSNLSTNPWLNLGLFIIFVIFAFSLFGYYDISLPSGLANKVDSKSNTKSWGGIFFMALTLAIVSFSCTGPILGLVLGNVTNAKLITPAMSGFGIGLGVPFALFAIFPNLLKALPKSGGWLTTLKVLFGFVELAFALKFLSNADLVKQWGLLKREVFVGIWIVICIITALYLLGKFKFKKDAMYNRTRVTDVLAILFLGLAAYLTTDFFGGQLNLVSGFPPPKFYSYSYKGEKLKNGTAARTHDLNGLKIYLYLEDAIAEAKKQHKPLMIDFTGWACVNCRRMEENVWVKPEIYNTLKDKYIIASLYVDEKTTLPDGEQFESPFLNGRAKTVGDKWFDLSLRHFNNAGQPFYALLDAEHSRILNTPVPYTPAVSDYSNFLQCGITNYKLLNP